MITIIKEYQAKTGRVTVTKYEEDGKTEYHVKHSNTLISAGEWHKDKMHAIAHAQFLSRY